VLRVRSAGKVCVAVEQVIVVTGVQGAGKTSFVRAQVVAWQAAGRRVAGVLAPAVFADTARVGYDVICLPGGERRPLARVDGGCAGATRVGPYVFDDEAFRAGTAALRRATADACEVAVLDEVGPLEIAGGGWATGLAAILAAAQPIPRLVVVVRPALVEAVAARFPAACWSDARQVTAPWPTGLDGADGGGVAPGGDRGV
jgi:nucleoside-triphosphatase THEP1